MDDIVEIYEAGDENIRMVTASNLVEWERTLELLKRWLPPAPATILDIGGGPGRYSTHLNEQGYTSTLLDPVPKHIRQAAERGVDAHLGDARSLPFKDSSYDAVLMAGPLYHLPVPEDRNRALTEATRCVRPGGVVLAAAMSRWAKPAVKSARHELGDPATQSYLLRILANGQDIEGDKFDLSSYNHDPTELQNELVAAGLDSVIILGIEGPLGADARVNPALADVAIKAARIAEKQAPHLSIHLLAAGVKPTS
jgi:ubiquinone/menaquinone biosynthesis C-methylase UbiE